MLRLRFKNATLWRSPLNLPVFTRTRTQISEWRTQLWVYLNGNTHGNLQCRCWHLLFGHRVSTCSTAWALPYPLFAAFTHGLDWFANGWWQITAALCSPVLGTEWFSLLCFKRGEEQNSRYMKRVMAVCQMRHSFTWVLFILPDGRVFQLQKSPSKIALHLHLLWLPSGCELKRHFRQKQPWLWICAQLNNDI